MKIGLKSLKADVSSVSPSSEPMIRKLDLFATKSNLQVIEMHKLKHERRSVGWNLPA